MNREASIDLCSLALGRQEITEEVIMECITAYQLNDSWSQIPIRFLAGLIRYTLLRQPVGHFLTACLENNFIDAVCKADNESNQVLPLIARFIYNEMPGRSWGNRSMVSAWLKITATQD